MIIHPMIIRPLVLIAAMALPPLAAAQSEGSDAGGQDVLGLFDQIMDDPSDYASDVDVDFEPSEVLAVNISDAALKLAGTLGFSVLDTTPLTGLGFTVTRLELPDGFINVSALLGLLAKADPLGLYTRNTVYRLAAGGATACEGLRCYGQSLVHWPAAGCARAVRIGMLDSAIDTAHPALRGQPLRVQRIGKGKATAAELEHGTAVAAQLVGRAEVGFAGLLPAASLFAADVFELDDAKRPYTDAFRLTQGLDWLARQGITSLNVSIAGPDSPVLHKAVQVLAAKGVAIAAAGGNLGPKGPPLYPAAYPEVLAVAAVDRALKPYAKGSQGRHMGVAAPGVSMWTATAGGSGRFRDGSSYAAPYATAALALTQGPAQKPSTAQRIQQLRNTAKDLGAPGDDPVFGAGLLQLPPGACGP
jgi:hypothetical protein